MNENERLKLMIEDLGFTDNLIPKHTDLNCELLCELNGCIRSNLSPWVIVDYFNSYISISLEKEPKILAYYEEFEKFTMSKDDLEKVLDYISKSYDIILKLYNSDGSEYDVEDAIQELKARNLYV